MRTILCVVLLATAVPVFAQQVHKLDFRDSKFGDKLVDYTLPKPEKYLLKVRGFVVDGSGMFGVWR